MGKAYGADAGTQWAKRVGVIIDGKGVITHYFEKVSAAGFPAQALQLL